jgi:hypothetical protein
MHLRKLLSVCLCAVSTGVCAADAPVTGPGVEIPKKLHLPEQSPHFDPTACIARYTVAYAQMYDKVRVKTKITNEDCAESSGRYTLRLRTVDEQGETQTRTIVEDWQRDSAKPLEQTRYYPMDGNSDLIWVKVKSNRKTSCVCATNRPEPQGVEKQTKPQ